MWRTVIVENPIDEFVLINSQDQVDRQADSRAKAVPVSPTQMAINSYPTAPVVVLEEKLNPDKPDACQPEVFERALKLCAGLNMEKANCVEDVCLTGDDRFATIAVQNEKNRAKLVEKAAKKNFDLGSLLNARLADDMAKQFTQRGVECKTIASGDELWNIAPFDKSIPAWTYSRYVEAKKMYLRKQLAATTTGTTTLKTTTPVFASWPTEDPPILDTVNENATSAKDDAGLQSARLDPLARSLSSQQQDV
jgi:hypothetical protein